MSAGGNIGTSATNKAGIANAFATLANLVDLANGTSPRGRELLPMSPCLSQNQQPGRRAGDVREFRRDRRVRAVFAAATPSGGTAPANTLDSALNIVRNPANNVLAIYNIISSQAPVQPTLTSAPKDWTLALTLTGGGMTDPTAVSVDAAGDVWVSNYSGTLSEFSPQGLPMVANGYTGYGLEENYGNAIDPAGNVWVSNEQTAGSVNSGNGSITELTGSGSSLSGSGGFTYANIYFPVAVAADTNGTIWVADYADSSVSVYSQSSGVISNYFSLSPTGKLVFPVAVAVDGHHNAWIANQGQNFVTQVNPNNEQSTTYTCCSSPSGVAVDQSNNIWVANYAGSSISELGNSGTLLINRQTGGGLAGPQGIAVDGAGTVWVANSRTLAGGLSEFSGAASSAPGTALSPAGGFGADAGMVQPFGVAIDAAGNVWVSNFSSVTVNEFVGMAAPVRTPLNGPPQLP